MNTTMMPRQLHEAALAGMKKLLDLGELTFSTGGGKNSGAFRYFKFQVMAAAADMETEQFGILSRAGLVEPCTCGASLSNGSSWTRCPLCAGSGFKAVEEKKDVKDPG